MKVGPTAEQPTPVCVWICGMSGTGKTTLANAVVARSRLLGAKVAQLDGDVVRDLLGERSEASYTKEGREKLSALYGRLCRTLVEEGISVVIATVSMSSKISVRNRREIPGYFEVVLSARPKTLATMDKKNLYSSKALVVGLDVALEEPSGPELRFETDAWLLGGETSAFDSAVQTIVERAGLV